jgi:TetR/AcrR family transcriptional regulator, cholesterol catabolism regulator
VPPSNPAVDQPAQLGRRERKKLQTKDRIIECAVALFAARGYDATTMDDIGECADVSRATVFNYFARKDDIVSEWFVRRRTDLEEFLAEAEQQTADTLSRIREAFGGLARVYEDDPRTVRAMVRAWMRAGGPLGAYASATPALLADTVRSGQEHGDIRRDFDAARAGLIMFDAYMGVLYRWVADESGRYAFEENLLATLDVILTAMTRTA